MPAEDGVFEASETLLLETSGTCLVAAEQLALLRDPVGVTVRVRRRTESARVPRRTRPRRGREDAHDRPTTARAGLPPAAGRTAGCGRGRAQVWASEPSRATA